MKNELITIYDEDGHRGIDVYIELSDNKILNILSDTLLNVASQIARTHNCNTPDCNVRYVATQLVVQMNKVINRKEKRHGSI